ncbi:MULTISPECIES: zinc-dependent metalloprotease [Butyricimonas]|uniref:zinc-dependent metalloprotease n=1 Tax=Butyricimonas TaxID=574697 RepID=UPI0007FB3561|nr:MULTISPECIES: zinc-dependent metalloprotease [Butyricimonas]
MRKYCMLLVSLLIIYPLTGINAAERKKKEKEQKAVVKTSKYDKLVKKAGCVTAKGDFITLHKVGGKLYIELPVEYLGRDMLLASTLTSASDNLLCEVGYKPEDPLHVKFTQTDSVVYLRKVNTKATYNEREAGMKKALERSLTDPMLKKFSIETYNNDSTAIVFDVTAFFARHNDMLPSLPKSYGGFISIKSSPNSEGELLGEIKAFEDNATIKTDLAYKVTMTVFGIFTIRADEPTSVQVTRTLLLLPEKKMRPRIADTRIGIFLTDKQHFSTEQDEVRRYSMINRWRLEPKDPEAFARGELVEPVKPIVFYVDDAFPEPWKQPIKEGTERWNKAFEKIGFKNVVRALDFPKDDPNFDPDNLKYSCIRYIPSTTANAMGPSWVDPTTGEIVNASVLVYNNVIQLINQWRFIQTAQVDPSVRNKKMPDDIVKESIAYVVAHEVGHCLGFMHNMAASAAYPVDSLRSASFTRKYGTTPSIMDYARYNYVAQPGDNGVKLTPPDLGIYDEFLVRWAYQPIPQARTAWEEIPVLESWLDEKAGDPRYRYGRQQLLERYDPSAIEEDLGDDPMKAGDYGIRNLKYILAHLDEWITDDPDGSHKQQLVEQLMEQYYRYITNVMYNVGGIYLTDVKEGTPGDRYRSVPKEVQKASLQWALKQFRDCDWLYNKPLSKKLTLRINEADAVRAVLAQSLLSSYQRVILSAHVSDDPYTLKAYFDDLYNGIWENTIRGKALTNGDKLLQTNAIVMLNDVVGNSMKKKGKFFLTSLDEWKNYGLDESGMVRKFYKTLKSMERQHGTDFIAEQFLLYGIGYGYNWQDEVDVEAIDNSKQYLFTMANKVKTLLESKIPASTGETREHYRMLLFSLNRALEGK